MRGKRIIIICALIVLFGVSVWAGFMINSYINFSKKESDNMVKLAENKIQEESVSTNYSEVTVSPNCMVCLTEKFKKCGHIIAIKQEVPREIINLDKDKVQEYYNGWNIDKFSADEIEVSRECSGICGEHYIVRESDGYISISAKNNIGEYIYRGTTDISVQYLPEEDLKKLEKGIEIVGRDNLNKFLEDYE